MTDETPTTAEGWERLAREHTDYADTERLGHLQAAARQTARAAYAKAAALRNREAGR